ncbi:MAG: hypothetical protein JSW39_27425 [Desulfobacterales bacterium]|nr:MAG: hypothetical protein JSW39_27425 [Desulfobacterales bacterium]
MVVARTGLRDNEAAYGGFDPLTIQSQHWDHKVYYAKARKMVVQITGDRQTGRLLGAQIISMYLPRCQNELILSPRLFLTGSRSKI